MPETSTPKHLNRMAKARLITQSFIFEICWEVDLGTTQVDLSTGEVDLETGEVDLETAEVDLETGEVIPQ